MKQIKLPTKPSKLITLGLRDLEVIEQNPSYKIDMGSWHNGGEVCNVCLAGAVMANTLKVNRYVTNETIFDCISLENEDKLLALNSFRSGYVQLGLMDMGYKRKFQDIYVPPYNLKKDEFKQKLRQIASKFKKAGL